MYKNKELLRYLYHTYQKSNKYILPLVILCLILGMSYTVAPLGVLESYTLSMVYVFFLMVWIGWGYNESDSMISEQVLILRIQNERQYYWMRLLFLLGISIMMAVIATFMPVLQNLINHFKLFNRTLLVHDVVVALALHIFAGYAGGITGAFLHPRVMKNRKMAALLLLIYAAMGVLKKAVMEEVPFTGYFTWLFPPVAEFLDKFVNMDFYDSSLVVGTILAFTIYSVIFSILHVEILVKNKF